MTVYIEPQGPTGLDRRVFRHEHGRIGAHIETAYLADYAAHGPDRCRWYGFANRMMPEGVTPLPAWKAAQ